jgi:hypothetical protein
MGLWEVPGLRAGQGRACLQRTAPASSCHTNPRKQQTTSQLGCTSPIPRCNGFPGHDTIRCCRCRVLSSHLYSCGSSNGSRSMQPMCKGPCGLEDTAEQSKVSCRPPFLTPPSPLSPLRSAVYLAIAALLHCCNSQWPTRPRPGWGQLLRYEGWGFLAVCPFLINNHSSNGPSHPAFGVLGSHTI